MTLEQKLRVGTLALLTTISAGNLFHNCEHKQNTPIAIKENTPIIPINNIATDAERLNAEFGYNLETKDLVALTRMLYFEGAYDPKNDTDTDKERSFTGIAEVIKNRYLFDTCNKLSPVENPFCAKNETHMYDGEKGLAAVIYKKNNGVHQFSSLNFHPDHFSEGSISKGVLNDRKQKLNQKELERAYNTLIGVLDGSIPPQTEGALYYKNSEATDEMNGKSVRWHDAQAFLFVENDCNNIQNIPTAIQDKLTNDINIKCRIEQPYLHDHTVNIGSHQFYTVQPAEDQRKEYIWDNNRGIKYNNGKRQ